MPFLVGIVIPSLGGASQETLKTEDRIAAIRLVLLAFEEWFGGGTPMNAPPGGIVRLRDGTVVFDADQTLVVAGTTRKVWRKNLDRVVELAERVGKMLRQESMAVLAFPTSESMLIFPRQGGQ